MNSGAYYMFSVRAVNTLGYSSYSPSITIMAASVPAQPQTPTVLSASSAYI